MQYVGIHTQQVRNNIRSMLLLCCFPLLVVAMVWLFWVILSHDPNTDTFDLASANAMTLDCLPMVLGIVAVWFLIAYFINDSLIRNATQSRPLERRENMRVYNIVENLCIAGGMPMPKVYIVDADQLNAYASGISESTYAVTVTRGLLNALNDRELAGVIGHELTHIRNRDTRLLIVSIVFVGIFSMIAQIAFRSFLYAPRSSRRNDKNGGGAVVVMLLVMVLAAIAYFFAMLTRFAISRKREYMADAGGAELCGDPLALASALRKISRNPGLDDVGRSDVAQLFICRPDELKENLFESAFSSLFSTHPDVKNRIAILENF
mgnify:CR=1 FL=1